jgi:hypothetical protein
VLAGIGEALCGVAGRRTLVSRKGLGCAIAQNHHEQRAKHFQLQEGRVRSE